MQIIYAHLIRGTCTEPGPPREGFSALSLNSVIAICTSAGWRPRSGARFFMTASLSTTES